MTTKQYFHHLKAGYADHRDRTPGKRQPPGEPLSDAVVAYWDGWQSGVNDFAAKFFREHRKGQRGLHHSH